MYSQLNLKKIKWEFRPSSLPQLKINFNFYINLTTSNLIVDRDQTTILDFTPGSSTAYYTSAAVDRLQGSLSSCDHIVREAVANAVAGSILDGVRWKLMDLVSEEVRKKFPNRALPDSAVFNADLNIQVERYDLSVSYDQDDDDDHFMVRAADSAIEMLEKCEVDSAMACSICMEDLGAAAASKLPCSHVFHDTCIHKWLKTSHYCPLCRYQLSTQ